MKTVAEYFSFQMAREVDGQILDLELANYQVVLEELRIKIPN